jgi:hypothetical protein
MADSVARQTLHPPVQYHPAGDPVAAPARGVTRGSADKHPKPQPATPQPNLRVPGPATDTKAAEKQAETDTSALADARNHNKNLAKLKNPIPEQISKAAEAIDVAQKEAERTTLLNATAQYENREQKRAIVMLAATELTQLRDGNPYPSRPTVAKLDAAQDRLQRATNDFAESDDSFIHAKEMLYQVAGVDMPPVERSTDDERSTDAATDKYPNLVMARGKFNQAWDQLIIFGPKDSKYFAQVETAGKKWRDAWAAARDQEPFGTKLRAACDAGFAYADSVLKDVIKGMKPR